MGFLTWLFGKKEQPAAAVASEKREPSSSKSETAVAAPSPEKPKPSSEAENFRRWRESGQPRAWVEARQGRWGHAEWLSLLEELKRSPYWPMGAEDVGAALEEAKQEWVRRN